MADNIAEYATVGKYSIQEYWRIDTMERQLSLDYEVINGDNSNFSTWE